MGKYLINGGRKLFGEIDIGGAKNAALPILAAAILNSSVSVLSNCPKLSDVFASIEILEHIGCKTYWDGDKLVIDSARADVYNVPAALMSEMRSSVIFLGALLARFGKARISFPGGCEIGARPIDMHLNGLERLGVCIDKNDEDIICEVSQLKGSVINLPFPSVGATENIMLAAVLAEGGTVIQNAAREPEIVDLQNFLISMGARIRGAGSGAIVIYGISKRNLKKAEYEIMPDRIALGTYLTAAAAVGGEVKANGITRGLTRSFMEQLRRTGAQVEFENNSVVLTGKPERINPIDIIKTMPHPGFPTDLQPQFMALLARARGTSAIVETVFESRFGTANELNKMGADITVKKRMAVVKGVAELHGAKVSGTDLRAGAALIIAALAAEGESEVYNSHFVERGYENIEDVFTRLGADIVKTSE